MPDYLVELQHVVEAIETRVPFGRFAVRAMLSLATLYALLFLVHSLWSEFIFPVGQFAVLTSTNAIARLRTGTPFHLSLPDIFSGETPAWIASGFLMATLYELGKRALAKMSAQIKNLESAVDNYRAAFWQPLTLTQKAALIEKLEALPVTLDGRDNRRIDIRRDDLADCADFAEDLAECFRKAGWQIAWEPRRTGEELITPGIHVLLAADDPRAQPLATVLTEGLGQLVRVPRYPADPVFLSQAMVPQIFIGRRPKASE
jgi:uncharacterized protein (DUF3820 family)